jgi:hypothetical protein
VSGAITLGVTWALAAERPAVAAVMVALLLIDLAWGPRP